MEHEYTRWHKALSKELCDYMDCFEDKPSEQALCYAEKVAKMMVKLYELEAYEIMFDCLEDCFGYDRAEHEFEDKDSGGVDYVLYAIQNSYNPARMTRGTPYYPTSGRGDGRRYGEMSTDRSMYPGYGMGYGMMNAADRTRMGERGTMGGRSGGRDTDRGGYQNHYMPEYDWDDDDERYSDRKYMNASRERDRDGRRRDSRGRYTNRIYNMAEDHDMKKSLKKLTPKEKEEWVADLESEDGHSGEVFSKSEIESIARKHNIKFEDEDYDLDTLWLMANVMYSDYASVISKMPNGNQPINYVKLAIAFLDDPDSDLSPEIKVAKYYRNIVEADED